MLRVAPDDIVDLDIRDGMDQQITTQTSSQDIPDVEGRRGHPLTGPIYVEGAEPGDLLEVETLEIQPGSYGWTSILPDFCFLAGELPDPFVVHWTIEDNVARSADLPGVAIEGRPFLGTVGVAPSLEQIEEFTKRERELAGRGGLVPLPDAMCAVPAGEPIASVERLRTVPPRENGGNMDVKHAHMTVGSRLLLPVSVPGALLSVSDTHFSQGDGESGGTAIEVSSRTKLRVGIHQTTVVTTRNPFIEFGGEARAQGAPVSRDHGRVGQQGRHERVPRHQRGGQGRDARDDRLPHRGARVLARAGRDHHRHRRRPPRVLDRQQPQRTGLRRSCFADIFRSRSGQLAAMAGDVTEVEQDTSPAADGPAAKASRARPKWSSSRISLGQRLALPFVWLVVIIVFGALRPDTFLTSANFSNILGSQAVLVILALALIVPLTAADYDLSVAATLTFSAMLIAVLNAEEHWPILLAILAALACGMAIGLINGFFVIVLGVDSLIATLGTGTFVQGLVLWISSSNTISDVSPKLVDAVILTKLFRIPIEFLRKPRHRPARCSGTSSSTRRKGAVCSSSAVVGRSPA